MDRRSFLRGLLATTATVAIAPVAIAEAMPVESYLFNAIILSPFYFDTLNRQLLRYQNCEWKPLR
jgi:hypothetical protein